MPSDCEAASKDYWYHLCGTSLNQFKSLPFLVDWAIVILAKRTRRLLCMNSIHFGNVCFVGFLFQLLSNGWYSALLVILSKYERKTVEFTTEVARERWGHLSFFCCCFFLPQPGLGWLLSAMFLILKSCSNCGRQQRHETTAVWAAWLWLISCRVEKQTGSLDAAE